MTPQDQARQFIRSKSQPFSLGPSSAAPTTPPPKAGGVTGRFSPSVSTYGSKPTESQLKAREFIKSIPQGITRSGASVGLSLMGIDEMRKEDLNPGSQRVFNFFFGSEPLESLSTRVKRAPDRAEELGIPRSVAEDLAVPSVVGLTALDFTGAGGPGKNLVRSLIKTRSAEEAATAATKAGVSLTSQEAAQIARTVDSEQIQSIIIRAATRSTVPDRVVQTVNDKTGKNIFYRIPEDEFVDVERSIDGGLKKELEAGTEQASGERFHITAKTPSQMAERGFEDGGTFSLKTGDETRQINMARFPEEVQDTIRVATEALGLDRYSKETFQQWEDAALELGINPRTFVENLQAGRITKEEYIRGGQILSDVSKKLNEVFVQIDEAERLGGDPGVLRDLNLAVRELSDKQDQLLGKLLPGATETARALASLRVALKYSDEPALWIKRAQKQLPDGQTLSVEQKQIISKMLGDGDREALLHYVAGLRDPDISEKLITLWKAGLLTAPTSMFANLFGNVTMSVLETASRLASVPADVALSLATNKRTTTASLDSIVAKLGGAAKGTKQMMRAFKRGGIYPEDVSKKWDLPRVVNFGDGSGGKLLNAYTKTVFGALQGPDLVFRQSALAEALQVQAEVIAKNEGFKGAAYKERVRELLLNPTNGMQAAGIDAAEYATFQEANVVADALSRAKTTSPTARTAIDIVVPFSRTPSNIVKTVFDYSPVGLLTALAKQIRPSTRSQAEFVKSFGRSVTGSSVMALGALMYEKGMITGSAPEDADERADFYANGKQAYSVKIGNEWFQINKLSPTANLFVIGAELAEGAEKDLSVAGITSTAGFTALKQLSEQPFLQGISGVGEAINNPDQSLENYVSNSVASTIPTAVGRIARTVDPKLRVSSNISEKVQSKIPGLSDNLPVRRDVFGNSVDAPGGRAALIDPFNIKEDAENPLINEAHRVGVNIGLPETNISGIRLTNREYSAYQQVQGSILEQSLGTIMSSPVYAAAADEDKAEIIEQVKREVRKQTRDAFIPIMVRTRFDVGQNVPDQILIQMFKEFSKSDDWVKASDEQKAKVFSQVLTQLQ